MKMQHRGWEALRQVVPRAHRRHVLIRWARHVLALLRRLRAFRAS